MNPNIAQLARLPRGKPFQSRLTPFIENIRDLRAAHVSYRRIAAYLAEQGLSISAAAVQGFVRVRDERRGRRLYALAPAPPDHSARARETTPEFAPSSSESGRSPVDIQTSRSAVKKYVFIPPPAGAVAFSDEDMTFNDPHELPN